MTSGAAFPSRPFLRYWRADAVSGLGSYVTLFALQALVVLTLDGSPGDVGWLNAAPIAGILADTWGIRPMLWLAVAIFVVVAAGLGATSFRNVRAPV